jgi:hypothetical protein
VLEAAATSLRARGALVEPGLEAQRVEIVR